MIAALLQGVGVAGEEAKDIREEAEEMLRRIRQKCKLGKVGPCLRNCAFLCPANMPHSRAAIPTR